LLGLIDWPALTYVTTALNQGKHPTSNLRRGREGREPDNCNVHFHAVDVALRSTRHAYTTYTYCTIHIQ
jgi:hypothetical protein